MKKVFNDSKKAKKFVDEKIDAGYAVRLRWYVGKSGEKQQWIVYYSK